MSVESKKAAPANHVSPNFKVQVDRLAAGGNKPEEWKEYIDTVKSRVHLLEESKRRSMISYMYSTAFKVIPDSSKTLAFARLIVDFADFKSKYDVAEAEKLLSYCRRTLRRFAIVHTASAELELKRDNKEKAVRILQRAAVSGAGQEALISLALQRLSEGKLPLLDEKEDKMGYNTSPDSGREISEELTSGQVGERDLLKLSLSGCRSNTQEVQQGLDYLTQHQDGFLQPHHKPFLAPAKQRVSPSRDENQHPQSHSDTSSCSARGNMVPYSIGQLGPSLSASTTSMSNSSSSLCAPHSKPFLSPKFASDDPQKLLQPTSHKLQTSQSHAESHSIVQSEASSNLARQPLMPLLKVPDSSDAREPSPAKKSLHRFHSTPVMGRPFSGSSFASSAIGSLRKFQPRNPLPPPRRVKVNPALLDDEKDDTSEITLSSFPLFDKESKMSTGVEASRTNDGVGTHTEPQGMQGIGLDHDHHHHQKTDKASLPGEGTSSHSFIHSNRESGDKKTDGETVSKQNCSDEKKVHLDRERHLSDSEKLKRELRGQGDAADRKTSTKLSSSVASLQGSESKSSVQKFSLSQGAQRHVMVPEESSMSSSATSCSEGSSGSVSEQAQVEKFRQKLFQEQQEIVKQQVLEQQQQMKQPAGGNPVYAVPSQNPNLVQAAYITPAKENFGSGQKTLCVNGMPYTVIRMVGRGGSAKVYQAYDPNSNRICALKVVNLSCANAVVLEGFKNEIALLKKLQHCDRVIKLLDSEYKEPTQKLLLVLEYGEIDLDKFIAQNIANDKQLLPSTVFYFWLQMVTAVHAMHKEGVIHSDLKPPNFILVAGNVKLIDFGIANSIQQDKTSVLKDIKMGTPSYMSPEMLVSNTTGPVDNKPRYKVGKRSDVWSLGCILYQMVYGRTPFQNVPNKIDAIINPNHSIDFPDKGDPALMDVLKKCLQRDVTVRPTTGELLKHPYLQKINTVPTTTACSSSPSPASKLSLLETMFASASPSTRKAFMSSINKHAH